LSKAIDGITIRTRNYLISVI